MYTTYCDHIHFYVSPLSLPRLPLYAPFQLHANYTFIYPLHFILHHNTQLSPHCLHID